MKIGLATSLKWLLFGLPLLLVSSVSFIIFGNWFSNKNQAQSVDLSPVASANNNQCFDETVTSTYINDNKNKVLFISCAGFLD